MLGVTGRKRAWFRMGGGLGSLAGLGSDLRFCFGVSGVLVGSRTEFGGAGYKWVVSEGAWRGWNEIGDGKVGVGMRLVVQVKDWEGSW